MTATHTHVITEFANPYLKCETCGNYVTGYVNDPEQVPECMHGGQLHPCGHVSDFNSECPSWSPVNGCQCQEHLGYVSHPLKEEKK